MTAPVYNPGVRADPANRMDYVTKNVHTDIRVYRTRQWADGTANGAFHRGSGCLQWILSNGNMRVYCFKLVSLSTQSLITVTASLST